MYQQAAREIADSLNWSDLKLEALLERMAEAINSKELPTRGRNHKCPVKKTQPPEFWGLVDVDDVNKWLQTIGVEYRWHRRIKSPWVKFKSDYEEKFTCAQTFKTCELHGLKMPTEYGKRNPAGINKVAESLGLTPSKLRARIKQHQKQLLDEA
jgi:hypothetical protein